MAKKNAHCPICSKASVKDFFPFCSHLCKSKDLLNWLGGRYAVPAQKISEDDFEQISALYGDHEGTA